MRRGEEAPAAKALVFRFLRSLAKNASWELICHLNTLFVSRWKFMSSCMTHMRHDNEEELFELYSQEDISRA